MIKTFRGLLADSSPGNQERIRLQTIKGKTGYRIVKFQVMSEEPYGGGSSEHLVQIWKVEQTTIDGNVNFTDSDLLAAAITNNSTSGYNYGTLSTIIFDNEIFNQDIFITGHDNQASQACNYYLELEVIPLDDAGAEYTTLKDMRQLG